MSKKTERDQIFNLLDKSVNIDVIILSNAFTNKLMQITLDATSSLLKSENNSIRFNVIIIESYKNLEPFQYPGTKTIYPREKFGYNEYMNIGIKMTNSPYICICNNDLIFHDRWASEILHSFQKDTNLVSASPLCSFLHPTNGIDANTGVYYGYEIQREVAGWCIFFKRDILKIIGLLDPLYKFWYADNDYSMMLQKHHLKHALVTSSIVDHLGSQTLAFQDIRSQLKLTIAEKYYYEYKWEGRTYASFLEKQKKILNLINSWNFK